VTAGAFLRRNCERPPNTEISGEDRAILAIAGFVRFISLLGSPVHSTRTAPFPNAREAASVNAFFTRRYCGVGPTGP